MERSPGAIAAVAAAAALGAAATAIAGCGDEPARVIVAPVRIDGSSCGRPADGRTLLVTALGEGAAEVRQIDPGAPVAIDDFGAGTRQLEIEVLGDGGAVRALGRTAPFVLDELPDGAVVPIFMAPPEGGCPASPMAEARDRPIVVAAGDGALVVGGRGAAGPLGTAEWYDPATGAFTPVAAPSALTGARGAAGMAAATLPDGRVVLTGGDRPVYVVFDPATRTFAPPGALFELRAHHAAVAIDATRVLVAGGCGLLDDDGACVPGTARTSTFVVDVADGTVVDGPTLALPRIGGVAVVEPALAGGAPRVLVVGGRDDAGAPVAAAERIDPAGAPGSATELVAGAGGVAAALASGSTLAAFAGDALPADGAAAVVVPVDAPARAIAASLARSGPTLTALEDGAVLVAGGAGDVAPLARYRPLDGRVALVDAAPVALDGAPAARAGHGAARLPDGTVLLVGGRDDVGAPRADAWVFRPDGPGPWTGAITVTPGDDADAPLVPLDPARVTGPGLTLAGAADRPSYAILGGPRPRRFALDAVISATGGAALLFGFHGPGDHDAIELVDGAPARLVRRAGGAETTACEGEPVALGESLAIAITVGDGDVAVEVEGARVLACALDGPRPGAIGVAAIGAGAAVTLSTISVAR